MMAPMRKRSAKILPFPSRDVQIPEPDSVQLTADFGYWSVDLYLGEAYLFRESHKELAEAEASVGRHVSRGLRRIPTPPVYSDEEDSA